jgi:hypothetical protein
MGNNVSSLNCKNLIYEIYIPSLSQMIPNLVDS